jgi:outer membrane protein assembly factor BamB
MRIIRNSLAALICFVGLMTSAPAQEWPTFRHDNERTGNQPTKSALSDPTKVRELSVKWAFPPVISSIFVSDFLNGAVPGNFVQQHFVYSTRGVIGDSYFDQTAKNWSLQQITTRPAPVGNIFVSTFAAGGLQQQHFVFRDENGNVWDRFFDQGDKTWHFQKINEDSHDSRNSCPHNTGTSKTPSAASDVFVSDFLEQQHFVFADATNNVWDYFFDQADTTWNCQQISTGGHHPFGNIFVSTFTAGGLQQQHFVFREENGNVWDRYFDQGDTTWYTQKINTAAHDSRNSCNTAPVATSNVFVSDFLEQQHFTFVDGSEIWDYYFDQSDTTWVCQQISTGGNHPVGNIFVSSFTPLGLQQQHFVFRDENGNVWDRFFDQGHTTWNFQKINEDSHDSRNSCPHNTGTSKTPSAASDVFVSDFLEQQHFVFADVSGLLWDYFFDQADTTWDCQQIKQIQIPDGAITAGPLQASPIVVDDTVFIGSLNGYFYALDAATGALKWQYPKVGDQALLGSCDPGGFSAGVGHYGIQSSASFAVVGGQRAVIFGAPDPSAEGGAGSARLFALNAQTGKAIWKSDGGDGSVVVAHVSVGCHLTPGQNVPPTPQSLKEYHERIAFSAPLVANNKVYVGIHDTGDSPIQQGHIVAVDLNTGQMDGHFKFVATGKTYQDGSKGGGVWNALATDGTGVYFTTGNTRIPWCSYPYTNLPNTTNCPGPFVGPNVDVCKNPNPPTNCEPSPNYGLSMLRVDGGSGAVVWHFNAVDYNHDGDPDWAAGAAVMTRPATSCGNLVASVQKDGWSYALDSTTGKVLWQFPPTGLGSDFNKNFVHGDDDYRRPGAVWNDVFIVRTGGYGLECSSGPGCDAVCIGKDCTSVSAHSLHALNACAKEEDRVRWIANIQDNFDQNNHVSYSTPTVTGGIVFIGTNENPNDKKGHLVILADPLVAPAAGSTCPNLAYTTADCPYKTVHIPTTLADIAMPDGGSLAAMRNEPVLAEGRVFVATRPNSVFSNAGHVYMLAPP